MSAELGYAWPPRRSPAVMRAEGRIENAVPGEALVVQADCGYSAMSRWSATVRLLVTVPGRRPELVTHSCLVERGQDLVDGFTVPVDVDPYNLSRLAIRWHEVPTIEERIAINDPALLDPEETWRRTRAREWEGRGRAPHRPPWAEPRMPGWPPREPLPDGRQPGTAWVLAHSANPRPHMRGREFVPPEDYTYRGRVSCGPRAYLGWLLLCVFPEYSERYAVHLRTTIRPVYFAPVLPVGINPGHREDLEILWSYAPGRPARRSSVGRSIR